MNAPMDPTRSNSRLPPFSKRYVDQVFQLSLTELAFTIIFLLLLLAAWLVGEKDAKIVGLEKSNEEVQRRAETAEKGNEKAKRELEESKAMLEEIKQLLASNEYHNSDEIITALQKQAVQTDQITRQMQYIHDLEDKLTALASIAEAINKAGEGANMSNANTYINVSVRLRDALEKALGKTIESGSESTIATELTSALKNSESLDSDNTNLRGQISFVQQQLALQGKKGFGLAPCWVNDVGKVEKLFDVTVSDDGLIVQSAWPATRQAQALVLPGIGQLINTDKVFTIEQFKEHANPILEWSKRQDPECRHYALVIVSTESAEVSTIGGNAVEEFFYPFGPAVFLKQLN